MGVRARRVEKYYQDLLTSETKGGNDVEQDVSDSDNNTKGSPTGCAPEKWKGQIEKVNYFTVFLCS